MITSLAFLVSGAICSQLFVQPVFAAAPLHPCFTGATDYDCVCENNPYNAEATCCYTDRITGQTGCQRCDVNTDTGEFENCRNLSKGRPDSSTIAPPPSGVAPPPSTETCPKNTARDSKGNCTPVTQTPKAPVPKSGPGNLLPDGGLETAPAPEGENDNETQSRINTSPTGGCIPTIKTECVPCDPGLPGGDCILEDDWETTIGTTAAKKPHACCKYPNPPPPPTNHVVKGPQGGEAEQPPATEEAPQVAPPPTCLAGQELDEDTNLCVPVPQEQEEQQQQQSEDGGGDDSSEDDGNNNDGDN